MLEAGRGAAAASRQANLTTYRSLVDRASVDVDTDSNWMITMSDIMSLLLVFFIIFFIMTRHTQDPRKRGRKKS